MSEQKKYPRTVVGAFIFNEEDELLLIKSVQWRGLYIVPGGGVELDESVLDALIREVKEETNLELIDIEFLSVTDGLGLYDNYKKPENHLIFLNYKARAKKIKNIKLNSEATGYKWQKIEDWLKNDDLSPTCKKVLEKDFLNKKDNFEDLYKRALADYQNLARQSVEEKSRLVKYANKQLILEILPVYNNLKTAINFSDKTVADNGWAEGIKYVIRQFGEILENNGVKEIKTVDEKFDHNKMEAVESEIIEDKKKDGLVAREIKAGYEMNGKIISPARVVVYECKNLKK